MLSFLDVTYLEENASLPILEALCQSIQHAPQQPAGICVYAHDLPRVVKDLHNLTLAFVTVVNFPNGNASNAQLLSQIKAALKNGATEIDALIPIQEFLHDRDFEEVGHFIETCRLELPNHVKLKIILETGEINNIDDIYRLSMIACEKGADFLKTSTGKTKSGATLEATQAMMQAIHDYYKKTNKKVGIKISGGVRTPEEAQAYIDQTKSILGENWMNPSLFRIGASKLFAVLCKPSN